MQEHHFAVCACGMSAMESIERCSVCAYTRQKRMSQHSYVLPERPAQQWTPPPSQPSSPRRSYEALASPRPHRNVSVRDAFTGVLSSGDASSSLFPSSMYRHPSRPNSDLRRTTDASSIFSTSSNSPTIPESQDSRRKLSRSTTPDARMVDSGYAPMAAGFARLSRKNNDYSNSSSDPALQERATSARPSLDLSARMFSGPA